MKTYEKHLTISKSVAKVVDKALHVEPKSEDECFDEDNVIAEEAVFEDGRIMSVQCIGVQYLEGEPSNCAWTQAVLFDAKGHELCCTEPCEEFLGDWELEYDGTTYRVNVSVESE